MMSQTDLPISLWGYALETAAFILNRAPTKTVKGTPYQVWHGKQPNLSFLKIWGCEAYVKRLLGDKLEPKSDKVVFVGYPKETRGYYFYKPSENKVFVARGGVFLEKEFVSKTVSGSTVHLEEIRDETAQPEAIQEPNDIEVMEPEVVLETEPILANDTQGPRRSERTSRPPLRYGFLVSNNGDLVVVDSDDPTTFQEAVDGPDSDKWLEAMKEEMQSMSDNQVWDLVEPTVGVKTIGCKWVFKVKTDMDGRPQTYKARLVAK